MGSSISYYLKSSSMQDLHDYASDLNNNDFNELNIFNNNIIDAKCNNDVKYYELFIYLHSELDDSIKTMYINNANKHNLLVDSYLNFIKNYDSSIDGADYCLNAGFDLICPNNINCEFGQLVCADHKVVCCMKFKNKYVSYYLYSRSSTPIKTPLRLANNVGIIDTGYRGNLCAALHNTSRNDTSVQMGTRMTQICMPDLSPNFHVRLVKKLSDTSRGAGGFGSTGQ